MATSRVWPVPVPVRYRYPLRSLHTVRTPSVQANFWWMYLYSAARSNNGPWVHPGSQTNIRDYAEPELAEQDLSAGGAGGPG